MQATSGWSGSTSPRTASETTAPSSWPRCSRCSVPADSRFLQLRDGASCPAVACHCQPALHRHRTSQAPSAKGSVAGADQPVSGHPGPVVQCDRHRWHHRAGRRAAGKREPGVLAPQVSPSEAFSASLCTCSSDFCPCTWHSSSRAPCCHCVSCGAAEHCCVCPRLQRCVPYRVHCLHLLAVHVGLLM